jgi:hypothetical protein
MKREFIGFCRFKIKKPNTVIQMYIEKHNFFINTFLMKSKFNRFCQFIMNAKDYKYYNISEMVSKCYILNGLFKVRGDCSFCWYLWTGYFRNASCALNMISTWYNMYRYMYIFIRKKWYNLQSVVHFWACYMYIQLPKNLTDF